MGQISALVIPGLVRSQLQHHRGHCHYRTAAYDIAPIVLG